MSFDQHEIRKIPIPERYIGCQTMLSYSSVVHHGHLRKRRPVDKVLSQMKSPFKWKQIYVVLRDGCMYFYNDETASKSRATSLYGFTSVERCCTEVSKDIPWPFRLVCALQETDRDYFFSAASEKDLMMWIKHIEEQINYANGFPASRNSTFGLVHPLPQTGDRDVCSVQRPLPNIPQTNLARKLQEMNLMDAVYVTESSSSDDEEEMTKKVLNFQGKKAKYQDTISVEEVNATTNRETHPRNFGVKPLVSAALHATKTSDGLAATVSSKTEPKLPISVNPTKLQKPAVVKPMVPGPTKTLTSKPVADEVLPMNHLLLQKRSQHVIEPESVYIEAGMHISNDTSLEGQYSVESDVVNAYWDKEPEEAEALMKSLDVDGAYMIRESKDKDTQTLMVCSGKVVRKYRILKANNKISLEAFGPYFDSLSELICHYKTCSVPQRNTKLTEPYSNVSKR